MPQCPQCNKAFPELPRKCPSCMADLDLLVEYVSQLQVGLDQADHLTRGGELGQAVWAYLSVLEVDPDNPVARRQVGQVVTAVRQFDRTAPGRRWLYQMRGEAQPAGEGTGRRRWLWRVLFLFAVALAFGMGYLLGGEFFADMNLGMPTTPANPPNNTMTGQ